MSEISREEAVERLSSALGRLKAINILLDPILTKTREAIGSITRKRLEETRFMTKPPEQIRRTIEMLMHILSTADADYMGLSTATVKRLNWRNDCLRPLRQSNILERLQTFVPHQLAKEPQAIQLLRDTYISPTTNATEVAEGVVSVSPSRRRKSRRNRVLPMSVIGASVGTTPEAAKNAMLTAESVAYANATCGVLFNWSIHMLELADTMAKHGDLYAQREQAREAAAQARQVLEQMDEKAQRVAEEAARLAKEEQERLVKIEQERLAKIEQERMAKIEQERLAKEGQERLAKIEHERLAKEEAARLAKEKQERLAKIEQERMAKQEQLAKEEQARLASQQERMVKRNREHAAEIERCYGQPSEKGDGMHLASNVVLSQVPTHHRSE